MWNTKFDIVTFINRIKRLGGDPNEIISHPDFDKRYCNYVPDNRHSTAEERGDHLVCTSYTQFVDQYLFYCQIRKAQPKKRSYKLNAIGKDEVGDEKLDYHDVGTISDLPYKDYELFVMYNIKDVLLCYKIEDTVNDIDFIYNLSLITRTRLNKVMKKSISIKNLFNKFCQDNGDVLGNNLNNSYDDSKVSVIIKDKRYIPELKIQGPVYTPIKVPRDIFTKLKEEGKYDIEREDRTIEGALVASPLLNKAIGMKMYNRLSSFIFDWVIDFDLSSLYPSIIDCFNIASNTQYGRIIIPEPSVNVKSRFPDTEDLGGKLLEDFNTRDYVSIGNRWLGSPTTADIISAMEKCKENDTKPF